MKTRTQAVAWLVLGLVAIIIVTAILTAAVSSSNASDKVSALLDRIEKVQDQQETARLKDAEDEKARAARSRALMHQSDVTQFQQRQQQVYIEKLVRILVRNGLTPPAAPTEPKTSPRPKAPAPTQRPSLGTPAPTEPSPRSPTTSTEPCGLLPVLCPFLKE